MGVSARIDISLHLCQVASYFPMSRKESPTPYVRNSPACSRTRALARHCRPGTTGFERPWPRLDIHTKVLAGLIAD